jgi:hypothetical protein
MDQNPEIQLTDKPDFITWKLSANGTYSSTMAYLAQFDATLTSYMIPTVWANWTPPKCKFFCLVDP